MSKDAHVRRGFLFIVICIAIGGVLFALTRLGAGSDEMEDSVALAEDEVETGAPLAIDAQVATEELAEQEDQEAPVYAYESCWGQWRGDDYSSDTPLELEVWLDEDDGGQVSYNATDEPRFVVPFEATEAGLRFPYRATATYFDLVCDAAAGNAVLSYDSDNSSRVLYKVID